MKEKNKMIFEKSCGAIVYREINNKIEFLSIKHTNRGYWCFPKEYVEKDENKKQTALKEILEETGLRVNLIGFYLEIYL